jgi:hypothetical protein
MPHSSREGQRTRSGALVSAQHLFDLRRHMGIRAGYRDLFGASATTWEQLREDLGQYTLGEVLDVIGRISAALDQADSTDQGTQHKIAFGLLGSEAADLIHRANALSHTSTNPNVVLFEPLQLVSLAKAALLFLPPDPALHEGVSYRRIAHALLRMTDLTAPIDFAELGDADRRREWIKYLFALGVFYRRGRDIHETARFEQLCLHAHEDLAGDPDYVNLKQAVTSSTGLDTDLLWMGLSALSSQWKALDDNRIPLGPVFIDEGRFLTEEFNFSSDERQKIFAIATADADTLQASIRAEYDPEHFRPFDYVPLAEKPLVRVGSRVFCASVPLLFAKLSGGLYYLLANSFVGPDRDQFTRFVGTVFEQYVVQLLTRMFERSRPLLVDGTALRAAVATSGREGVKVADCFVVVQGIALVVEAKARFFGRAARSGEDFDAIVARIQDVFSRGARQLESTIELAESGALEDFGVRADSIERYVPIVVCLDETPLAPLIYDEITPVTPSRGAAKTALLQVVGVSELEHLEDAVARSGLYLHRFLDYKARSGRQAESLRNAILQDPSLRWFSQNSPHLERAFKAATQRALESLRARQR